MRTPYTFSISTLKLWRLRSGIWAKSYMKTAKELCYWLKVNIYDICIAKDTYTRQVCIACFYHVPQLLAFRTLVSGWFEPLLRHFIPWFGRFAPRLWRFVPSVNMHVYCIILNTWIWFAMPGIRRIYLRETGSEAESLDWKKIPPDTPNAPFLIGQLMTSWNGKQARRGGFLSDNFRLV